jgi:hypothetical protein
MTSLLTCMRRTGVCRWTVSIAATSFLAAIGGCAEDRAANSEPERTPIAVTAGGIEIMEVVKNERERTVEVVVVAGGEERQATFEPLLDGPLPFGMVATLHSNDEAEVVQIAFGWNEHSGANWTRQQVGGDVFELMRTVADERVREEYALNGKTLVLEYADLAPVVASRATAEFLRGAPNTSQDPEVIEFVEQLRTFDAFAAENPNRLLTADADGELLPSLFGDPVLASTVFGDEPGMISKSIIGATCRALVTCMSISCRLRPGSLGCLLCTAGVSACQFLDLLCAYMGCNCCFD